MEWVEKFFWQNHFWAALSLISVSLVLISSIADRRRHRRVHIDDVGFVPWTAITIFSVLCAVLSAALAIKGL
jgi:hypothetical protein